MRAAWMTRQPTAGPSHAAGPSAGAGYGSRSSTAKLGSSIAAEVHHDDVTGPSSRRRLRSCLVIKDGVIDISDSDNDCTAETAISPSKRRKTTAFPHSSNEFSLVIDLTRASSVDSTASAATQPPPSPVKAVHATADPSTQILSRSNSSQRSSMTPISETVRHDFGSACSDDTDESDYHSAASTFEDNAPSARVLAPTALQEPIGLVAKALSNESTSIAGRNTQELAVPSATTTSLSLSCASAPASAADESAKSKSSTIDECLTQVLEVIPDVQPAHALELLRQHLPANGTRVAELVVDLLVENAYPKVECNKSKRKRDSEEDAESSRASKVAKVYSCKDRPYEGGPHYHDLVWNQLMTDFPLVPVPHIRSILAQNKGLYAPTFLELREQLKMRPCPIRLKTVPTRVTGKCTFQDEEFDREMAWLSSRFRSVPDAGICQGLSIKGENAESGIECACCFTEYSFDKMVQCPDAHLFCISCVTTYVETRLGEHNPNMKCMDQSDCKLLFSDGELARILSPKLLDLYYRVKQAREIEAAEIDGLEECPFCEYKAVIDNADEKLFRCQREECGAVSCRMCKKVNHLPKSCKEVEEDKGLDARHKIEEAMTGALMRNCPKCKKAFVKESGCNKMTCPSCKTVSCYVCRQIIKGYDHFDSRPPGHNRAGGSRAKCLLWDDSEQRHSQEVAAARAKAIEDVRAVNPEIDGKVLDVTLPKPTSAVGQQDAQRRARFHAMYRPRGHLPVPLPGHNPHERFLNNLPLLVDARAQAQLPNQHAHPLQPGLGGQNQHLGININVHVDRPGDAGVAINQQAQQHVEPLVHRRHLRDYLQQHQRRAQRVGDAARLVQHAVYARGYHQNAIAQRLQQAREGAAVRQDVAQGPGEELGVAGRAPVQPPPQPQAMVQPQEQLQMQRPALALAPGQLLQNQGLAAHPFDFMLPMHYQLHRALHGAEAQNANANVNANPLPFVNLPRLPQAHGAYPHNAQPAPLTAGIGVGFPFLLNPGVPAVPGHVTAAAAANAHGRALVPGYGLGLLPQNPPHNHLMAHANAQYHNHVPGHNLGLRAPMDARR